MVFSSVVFIFAFLPAVLILYFVPMRRSQLYRDLVLVVSSFAFYAWGELEYTGVLLGSVITTWLFGRLIASSKKSRRFFVSIGIIINLAILVYFKYAGFILGNLFPFLQLIGLAGPHAVPEIHLPIGISFFAFQGISYLIDVYRNEVPAERSLFKMCLYKSFFPQLIAGPIVRYKDIRSEMQQRSENLSDFASGAERFMIGMSQKVLIANVLGNVADQLYSYPLGSLTAGAAWTAAMSYFFQIYFDFNGYSNMAIGLGRMFGFHFLENFNYPYTATSITDFWRRWHISLSSWFRDYVYIPLGGNRFGVWKTYRNLWIVFILCGIWHGASWNFLVWGILHGTLIVVERAFLDSRLARLPRVFQHLYTILLIVFGWVFFRIESFSGALTVIGSLCGMGTDSTASSVSLAQFWTPELALCFVAAAIFSTPFAPILFCPSVKSRGPGRRVAVAFCETLLFVISLSSLAAQTFNPFIYFRF